MNPPSGQGQLAGNPKNPFTPCPGDSEASASEMPVELTLGSLCIPACHPETFSPVSSPEVTQSSHILSSLLLAAESSSCSGKVYPGAYHPLPRCCWWSGLGQVVFQPCPRDILPLLISHLHPPQRGLTCRQGPGAFQLIRPGLGYMVGSL